MTALVHRGQAGTAQNYRGIPIHAAEDVHQIVVDILTERLRRGARVADLGGGHGALSLRLHDAGFDVVAFDLDPGDWLAGAVPVHRADLGGSLVEVEAAGPFAAICAVEIIEHLENPRDFLRKLGNRAGSHGTLLVLSTPNPLDTFSSVTHFRRGIFNWFGPQHYLGGGHISILPWWLIDEHLAYLGLPRAIWRFVAPVAYPSAAGRLMAGALTRLRRFANRSGGTEHFEGQTAIGVVPLGLSQAQ